MIESRSRASTLAAAAAVAGGVQALARRLRVPTKQLGCWIDGDDDAPLAVFLRAVAFLQCVVETPGGRRR